MACTRWLLLAALTVTFTSVSTVEIDKVLRNVPQQDKYEFLRYYLEMGYELSQGNAKPLGNLNNRNNPQFSDLDSVSQFALDLYKWVVETRSLKNTRSYRSNIMCFNNGQCVDIGDVGIHP